MSNNNTNINTDTKKYNRDFIYSIPESVLHHQTLTYLDKHIYMLIRSFMDTTGDAYPSNGWIAKRCGIDNRSAVRSINRLISEGLVIKKQINNRRHLFIKQSGCPVEVVTLGSPPHDPRVTPPHDPRVTQLDQNNIKSNNININKNACETPVSMKTSSKKVIRDYEKDERFMRFYNAYPKKLDPNDAWKAFKSIVGSDDQLLEDIIQDIELRTAKHTQWQDKKFIKYPAVYLRKGEYLGEIYNEALEKKEKERIKKEENAKRLAEQERISKKRQAYEATKHAQYNQEGKAYRQIVATVAKRTKPKKTLKEMLAEKKD